MTSHYKRMIPLILFIVGTVMIFSSGSFGEWMGNIAINQNNGSLSSNDYLRIVYLNASNCRAFGCVLSLISGFEFINSKLRTQRSKKAEKN